MSGHSKWNNIKNKKEKSDAQRGKIFTKLGREILVAVKEGGPDPAGNSKLRDVIAKCKANNMPNDNIDRSIKKAAGDGANTNYEDITYEGYGPNGVAIMIEAMTDNRNRTAGDVRHILDKFGGNLGTNGAVSWMFDKKGVIVIEKSATSLSEDDLMLEVIDAGAENFEADEEFYEITTAPDDFSKVREYLENKGISYIDAEVKKMCDDYKLSEKYQELKEWYNGYLFGEANVYNPWSSIKYIKDHLAKKTAFPEPYWANTSSNAIVRTLIDRADREVKDEIEELIAGGTIEKPVHEDITYDEIYETMDNLWNFMFFTGYFKKTGERFEDVQRYVTLKIPNQEVLYIFKNKIRGWFQEQLKERNPQRLFDAVVSGDTEAMEEDITDMLYETISFYDYYETFYHGFLAGILYGMHGYTVKSNREAGNGRTDLYLKPASIRKPAYLFEFKYTKKPDEMEQKAEEALLQIAEKKYDIEIKEMGYKTVIKYGICFFGRDCVVKKADK